MSSYRLTALPVPNVEHAPLEVSADEVLLALRDIVRSPVFAKAHRMCRLLTFLVEKKLAGAERDINEYAIGLDVFERHPGNYSTAEDPLVRVQVGRLRERLNIYYAAMAGLPAFKICIPLGNYVPIWQRSAMAAAHPQGLGRDLVLLPFSHLGGPACAAFAKGLDDELGTRLFAALGDRLRLRHGAPEKDAGTSPFALRLEGSVRLEARRARATLRLLHDGASRYIAWQAQFDHAGRVDLCAQEALAGAACAGLQGHLFPPAPPCALP
jgi:hypothetical protein